MEYPSGPQLGLFDADAELSSIGVSRRQLRLWWDQGLPSFDPGEVDRFERWHYQEIAFLYHLVKTEPSVNALRKFLAPLKRPYSLAHGNHYFNFKEQRWERRYALQDLLDAGAIEAPEEMGHAVRVLIRQLALSGARTEVLKTLAVLREVLPDDWLRDPLPED